MSQREFPELVALARSAPSDFTTVPRAECVNAAKQHIAQHRESIRGEQRDGASGETAVARITALADEVLLGALEFALAASKRPQKIREQFALVALGGYGRRELNPFSDLDICILRTTFRRDGAEHAARFLGPFLWDIGWENSLVQRTVRETLDLARADLRVFSGLLHARFLAGDEGLYGDLRYRLAQFTQRDRPKEFAALAAALSHEAAPTMPAEIYAIEPNLKDTAGGLRHYHQALWLLKALFNAGSLEQAAAQGLIAEDQLLAVEQALDFFWRVRNELHFIAGRREDRLTFENEHLVAVALGYTPAEHADTSRFKQDFYQAARAIQRFRDAVGKEMRAQGRPQAAPRPADEGEFSIVDGCIEAGATDPRWFEENPSRLMSVFWEVVRRGVPLGRDTLERVSANLHLAGDAFRANPLVRRFFLALCGRPVHAGLALRQMAQTGLLGKYFPEFQAVVDVVRYEDFHHFPVDEHTLRAVESLGKVPDLSGTVGSFLKMSLEHLSDPHILVLALLLHDLGKAKGEEHSEEGMRLARTIGQRIGLPEEDIERVAFLVLEHLTMTHIALYRDVDDADIVEAFAHRMKSEHRLRALLLLSYADLSAVGPNVWNDWKGALLLKLYLRAERVLTGQAEVAGEAFWEHPKTAQIEELIDPPLRDRVKAHVRDLGAHYLAAFAPSVIADHIACVAEAGREGVAVRVTRSEDTRTTEVVVCAGDHVGLFEEISGAFASQFVDIQEANLFTLSGGMAVDCFRATRAGRGDALTDREMESLAQVLKSVVSGERKVDSLLQSSQRRVYASMQQTSAAKTDIRFDNQASRNYTVIDVWTGDRTGLLYDIAKAFRERGIDVSTARIVTDARRVRDSFYVSLRGGKIESPSELAATGEALRNRVLGRVPAQV